MVSSEHRILALSLVVVGLALLSIGLVSNSILRHSIQTLPVVASAVIAWRFRRWAPYSALPILIFWMFIVALIWLFLLNIADVVTGEFSVAEIALTIVIGVAAIVGSLAALRVWTVNALATVVVFVCFLALQVIAMWVSLQPFAADQ
jgi:hypothetical protein